MAYPENIDKTVATLQEQIADLRSRLAITDEDAAHLKALKSISFTLWYDPDNEACAKYGKQMEPHIAALCAKFKIT